MFGRFVKASMLFRIAVSLLLFAAVTPQTVTNPSFSEYAKVAQHTCNNLTTEPRREAILLTDNCGVITSPCYPDPYPANLTEGLRLWSFNHSQPIAAIRFHANDFQTRPTIDVLIAGRSVRVNGGLYLVSREFLVSGALPSPIYSITDFENITIDSGSTVVFQNVEPLFVSFTSSANTNLRGFNISYCVDIDACRSTEQFCFNGGICVRTGFESYTCQCLIGLNETRCETQLDVLSITTTSNSFSITISPIPGSIYYRLIASHPTGDLEFNFTTENIIVFGVPPGTTYAVFIQAGNDLATTPLFPVGNITTDATSTTTTTALSTTTSQSTTTVRSTTSVQPTTTTQSTTTVRSNTTTQPTTTTPTIVGVVLEPITGAKPAVNVSQELPGRTREHAFAVQNPCSSLGSLFADSDSGDTTIEVLVREAGTEINESDIGVWSTVVNQTPIGLYVAADVFCPLASTRKRRETVDDRFIVGEDESCDFLSTQVCNGPLPAAREFVVSFRSTAGANSSPLTEFSTPISTLPCAGQCDHGSVCKNVTLENGRSKFKCVCLESNCTVTCEERSFTLEDGRVFEFPDTFARLVGYSLERCGHTGQPVASVPCKRNLTASAYYVGIFDFEFLTVIPCRSVTITDLVDSVDLTTINSTDLERVLLELDVRTADANRVSRGDIQRTVDLVAELGSMQADLEITPISYQSIVAIADHVILFQLNQSATITNQSAVVQALTSLAYSVILPPNGNVSVLTPNIAALVQDFNNNSNPFKYEPEIYNNDGQLYNPAVIEVPVEVFDRNNDTVRAAFLLHNSSNLFVSDETADVVISADIGLQRVDDLRDPVNTIYNNEPTNAGFSQNDTTVKGQYVNHTCVFWNFSSDSWSTEGCFLVRDSKPPQCRCNHLTNFALLVSIYEAPAHISLQIVTYICASLSMLCLVITVLILLSFKEIRKRKPMKILINLCVILTIVFLIFMVGIDNRENEASCVASATLLHYFLLCVWCWMGVYANFLYFSLVKIFEKTGDQYLIKAGVFAYGVPAVIVALNAGITEARKSKLNTPPIYGEDPPSAFVSSYLADNMCWIKGYSLYFAFLLPVGAILLYNVVVFFLTMNAITSENQAVTRARSSTSHVPIAMTLAFTLGLVWFLAFYMMIADDPIFLTVMTWVFSIVSTLQGALIFLLTCVRKTEVKRSWYPALLKYFRLCKRPNDEGPPSSSSRTRPRSSSSPTGQTTPGVSA